MIRYLDKSKYYFISGEYSHQPYRRGQYELTMEDGTHCFFMDDTLQYEYFTGRIIKESQ